MSKYKKSKTPAAWHPITVHERTDGEPSLVCAVKNTISFSLMFPPAAPFFIWMDYKTQRDIKKKEREDVST